MTEQTEIKPTEKLNSTEIKPSETENSANSDLPEVKLSSKDKKKLRNKKYYETKKLNKPTEKRLNKPSETENSANSSNSYVWVVAIIALLSICIFALYLFSHGQVNHTGNVDGLPYY